MPKTEKINLNREYPLPEEYACECEYCQQYKGMLIRKDGSMYNRNERRDYMVFRHGGGGAQHINPTPLHIARWAVQKFTHEGDWVLDPFAGTGTTIVEAINHGRNGLGIEIDTWKVAQFNVEHNGVDGTEGVIIHDDARKLWKHVHDRGEDFQLVIFHPPYSGDEQSNAKYDRSVSGNMAFMKESKEYWRDMKHIFLSCYNVLKKKGIAIIGVKEMMRNKEWWDLHIRYADLLKGIGMKYKGMVLLPHYPRTLHLNTYFKRYGIHPSYWQTIMVFQK